MMLYILRHAEAEKTAESGGDEARKLTVHGKDRMSDAAAGMRAFGLKFDAILTSPLVRACETAEIVAGEYSNSPSPQVLPALSGGVPAAEAVTALAPFARHDHVLIVGHEPQLSGLASLLLTGSPDGMHLRLKKGACVALDVPKRLEQGAAELRWMLTQRQLRRLRK
jgi:phosphohistidine phosphatase